MAYLAVNKDGTEYIFPKKPVWDTIYWSCVKVITNDGGWYTDEIDIEVELPKGTIEKLIGRSLTYEDEPFEYI